MQRVRLWVQKFVCVLENKKKRFHTAWREEIVQKNIYYSLRDQRCKFITTFVLTPLKNNWENVACVDLCWFVLICVDLFCLFRMRPLVASVCWHHRVEDSKVPALSARIPPMSPRSPLSWERWADPAEAASVAVCLRWASAKSNACGKLTRKTPNRRCTPYAETWSESTLLRGRKTTVLFCVLWPDSEVSFYEVSFYLA